MLRRSWKEQVIQLPLWESRAKHLCYPDPKMGGSKKEAAAQRPDLVPNHHFKNCLHSISVPSWKMLNPVESVHWSATKMIVCLWGTAEKGEPSCTERKKMLRCPERYYFRRGLEIMKSNKLFLTEREAKMLVWVNINLFTAASLLKME